MSAGDGGRAGRVDFSDLDLEEVDVSADEEGEDGEETVPQRTIEQLRNQSGGETVDRMPIFTSDELPVGTGQWPLGFPLQGIPRIAAVVNLNYIYDDDRGEWVRQKKSKRARTAPVTIDGFEDGNLDEYVLSDTSPFAVVNSPVFDGSKALECSTSNTDSEFATSVYGLDGYPIRGDTFEGYVRSTERGNSEAVPCWFVQETPDTGSPPDPSYSLRIEWDDNRLALRVVDGGSPNVLDDTSVPDLPADKWLRVGVQTSDEPTMTVTLEDGNGSVLGEVSSSDDTLDEGGVSWGVNDAGGGGGTDVFFDAWVITDAA